jgi:hypothetical protein
VLFLRLRTESHRGDEQFRLAFPMEGADPAVAARYAGASFEEVLIWTDQVWPVGQPLHVNRSTMFEAATALRLTRATSAVGGPPVRA